MNHKSIYTSYLFPELIHITIVALLAGILKRTGCELGYNSISGIVLIVVGGVSSAFWGVTYQIKYNEKRPLSILKDFFGSSLFRVGNCIISLRNFSAPVHSLPSEIMTS